jgi:hypothetical protein
LENYIKLLLSDTSLIDVTLVGIMTIKNSIKVPYFGLNISFIPYIIRHTHDTTGNIFIYFLLLNLDEISIYKDFICLVYNWIGQPLNIDKITIAIIN